MVKDQIRKYEIRTKFRVGYLVLFGFGLLTAATYVTKDRGLVPAALAVFCLVYAGIYRSAMDLTLGLDEELGDVRERLDRIEQELKRLTEC